MTTTNEPLADARDMFAVHTMFRREFGLMPGLIRAVTAGDTRRAMLVADHVALVSGVLNVHHSAEDQHIWPLLRARCPAECAPLVEVMEEQHHAIHNRLLQATKAAQAWRVGASAGPREALADAVDRLIPVTGEHLTLEEERVVPLIEKHITKAEYAVLAQEGAADVAPDKLPTVLGMVLYEAAPAVVDMVVAEMPAEVQPNIKDLAATAYAAYAKELHGTGTPPRVTS
jgi:hemerythrin HHE cation binding domain-containing protein